MRVSRHWSEHPLYVRLNTSDISVFRQVFIEQEYGITRRLSSEPGTILDAGANIGLTTIFLAQQFPSATIYSLEPELVNLELLRQNTRSCKNVRVIHGALWNRDEPLEVESLDAESWAFRVRATENAERSAKVQGYRLGSLLRELDVKRLGLLKMDIEGAEFEVLEDHADWLDKVDNIVVELHETIRPGCTARFIETTQCLKHSASGGELVLISRKPLRT